MPSPNYADKNYRYAPGDEFMQDYAGDQKAPLAERLRDARGRYDSGTGKAPKKYYGSQGTPKHLALSEKEKGASQKEMQNKLSSLQRTAPKTLAGIKKGKKRAIAGFVFRLFAQIDITTDWLFILLFSFAFLKDIFDIVFAAVTASGSSIPIINFLTGPVAGAIGMTISFVGDLMFLCLTVTVLVLIGSSLKNRGMAKYFIGIAMEFIAEALPGISWLPWTVIYVMILYGCVLYDRAYGRQAEQATESGETENEPASIPEDGLVPT